MLVLLEFEVCYLKVYVIVMIFLLKYWLLFLNVKKKCVFELRYLNSCRFQNIIVDFLVYDDLCKFYFNFCCRDFGKIFFILLFGIMVKFEFLEGVSFLDGFEVKVVFGGVWK